MAFTHVPYMTEAEVAAAKKQRETEEQLKVMRQWQDVIHIKLGIWCRNGPSEALRNQIAAASEQYGEAFRKIMASSPQRIAGSSQEGLLQ